MEGVKIRGRISVRGRTMEGVSPIPHDRWRSEMISSHLQSIGSMSAEDM